MYTSYCFLELSLYKKLIVYQKYYLKNKLNPLEIMTSNEKNTASIIHLSTLSQFIIPFGNFIFPIIIWSSNKNNSEFIDANGKQTLNFQLSMFLYTLLLLIVSVPALLYSIFKNITFNEFENGDFVIDQLSAENITGIVIIAVISIMLLVFSKIAEFILVIIAVVKSSNGEIYKYPFSINFIK